MRIAFCGKGGSGKTTVASLFTRHLLENGRSVIAIDADINQTLGTALALPDAAVAALPALGSETIFLKDHVRGSNPLLPSADLVMKTTPPGPGSRMVTPSAGDPVFQHYAYIDKDLTFLKVGGFDSGDIGTQCFHAKTGAVELLLNHLQDGVDDTVVVDMTAGADAFASGLFTRFDLTVLMVEPTLQSVSAYRQYVDYARDYGLRIIAAGNKVDDAADLDFLNRELGDALLGVFMQSRFVKQRDKGIQQPIAALEPENAMMLAKLDLALRSSPRDWRTYWRQTVEFHLANAESWANAMTGQNLGLQVDRDYLDRLCA
jgi:CO dehydrogenase maturation factor